MEKARKGVKRILALIASLVRTAGVNIILFFLAGVIISSGVYLRSQPEWIKRTDVREYNQGVSAVPSSFEVKGPLIVSPETLPSGYPIERARAYFEKAGLESTDKKLKSLAFYNFGTMTGRRAFYERLPSTRLIKMAEAITMLAEAIRNDPNNEDAKFNRELLERVVYKEETEQEAPPGGGYSPGTVDKRY